MELAVELGVPVREVELVREDLAQADEVFLTNVSMGVMPVVRIGREPVGDEKPGEITRQIHDAFVGCVARECGEE
jgi:branched-subunit amino acid aminotransferase/4-amino-4-deoxychorismate lyase